jgi:hypothetical protein
MLRLYVCSLADYDDGTSWLRASYRPCLRLLCGSHCEHEQLFLIRKCSHGLEFRSEQAEVSILDLWLQGVNLMWMPSKLPILRTKCFARNGISKPKTSTSASRQLHDVTRGTCGWRNESCPSERLVVYEGVRSFCVVTSRSDRCSVRIEQIPPSSKMCLKHTIIYHV